MRAFVAAVDAVKSADTRPPPAGWNRPNNPQPAPNALLLFARLAGALLDASGWMLLHRPADAWQMLTSDGVPEQLRLQLLAAQVGQPVAMLPANLESGGVSADGHILKIGIGHGEKPRYSCILLRNDDAGPFRRTEIASLVRCLPHVAVLLAQEEQLHTYESTGASQLLAGQLGSWLLDKLGADVCLVDRELHPVLMSQAMHGMPQLRLQDNRIAAVRPEDDHRLRATVAAVLERRAGAAPVQGLSLGKDDARRPLLVASMEVAAAESTSRLAVLLMPREAALTCDAEIIRSMFGLSRVEAGIVKLLFDGCAPNDAAERMRMSQNTLRHYMKAIFRKLNVHRQSDLVRLVAATTGLLRSSRHAATPALPNSATMALSTTSSPSELH